MARQVERETAAVNRPPRRTRALRPLVLPRLPRRLASHWYDTCGMGFEHPSPDEPEPRSSCHTASCI